jgi:hypothetical protein
VTAGIACILRAERSPPCGRLRPRHMRAGTPLTGAGFLGSRCVPFPVAGIRTPKSPLESGDACAPGTGRRGRSRTLGTPAHPAHAGGDARAPWRCLHTRRQRARTPAHPGDARVPGTRTRFNSSHESTAKRACHRSGAAFTEEDATASRYKASCFTAHIFEVLCAPGVSAVRFCSKVNHEKREAPHRRGLHGGAAQSITPRGLCACYQLLTSGTIRP